MPTSRVTIADELRAATRFTRVFAAIAEAGAPEGGVYLVGGAVRDVLIGRPSSDLDLLVEGDAVGFAQRLADTLGGTCRAHRDFGTAVVTSQEGEIDVATARTESYAKPAALPDVAFATLGEDLERRDFTVNAIAASLKEEDFGRLIDPHDGRADLAAATIRVLHDGSFVDDPTRIFRAIRYENRFGFRMDEHTEELARTSLRQGFVGELSSTRLRDELVALLDEEHVAHTIERLADLGAAHAIHPALAADDDAIELAARLHHLAEELDVHVPIWRLRLAVLFRNVPADEIRQALDRLDFSRRDEDAIGEAVKVAPRLVKTLQGSPDPAQVVALVESLAPDAPLFALALSGLTPLRDWFTHLRGIRLEITGADLVDLGLKESPKVGEVLDELRRRKLRGDLDGRESELAAARELIGG
jgi:tRNA nucleotidyltransferase (CCA-adding enzyme)